MSHCHQRESIWRTSWYNSLYARMHDFVCIYVSRYIYIICVNSKHFSIKIYFVLTINASLPNNVVEVDDFRLLPKQSCGIPRHHHHECDQQPSYEFNHLNPGHSLGYLNRVTMACWWQRKRGLLQLIISNKERVVIMEDWWQYRDEWTLRILVLDIIDNALAIMLPSSRPARGHS